jgi:hypothetical protein
MISCGIIDWQVCVYITAIGAQSFLIASIKCRALRSGEDQKREFKKKEREKREMNITDRYKPQILRIPSPFESI